MFHKRNLLLTAGILFALFSSVLNIFSQDRVKMIRVSFIDSPPKINGLIEDSCWKNIQPVSEFFQFDPLNGEKASEETFVWAAFDQKKIYFAFLMKDTRPDKIWAELTPRNDYENNDSITLILDTYNDKRTSISFTVNPKGVQKNSVETIWESGAIIRSDGWAAEMAIPFKSLRFSPQENQVWGINFERFILHLNEKDYWTDVERDKPLLQQMGELSGLSGIRPGYNLEFFPYAGFRSSRWDGAKDDKMAEGLDVKYGILPNLILDLTASPDFSEVESDPFIYQLSPYENYFRENRPFFTEGSRYFQLSTESEHEWEQGLNLFYSRRISDPRIAAKISGKTGGYAFGILGAINKEEEGDTHFSVVRMQKDIFRNSQLGIYYAGMDISEEYNRNFAVDYNFNFKDFYYFRGTSAFSFSNDSKKKNNGMHILSFQREPDAGLQLTFNFQRIEKNVDVRTGFINKIDFQSLELTTGYAWRFNQGKIKRFSLDLSEHVEHDSQGHLIGNSLDFMFFMDFFSRISFHGGIDTGKSRYQVYDENSELFWTKDFIHTHGGHLDFHWERGGFLKEISLEGRWEKRGIYNEDFTRVEAGSQKKIEGSLALRPRSNFEWSFSGNWIQQVIERSGEKVFDGVAYATSLHLQITRSLFLSTRLLGETREDQYNFDFLIGYYFGAGNIIQLSYKKSAKKEGFWGEGGHSITLKLSYLLRI